MTNADAMDDASRVSQAPSGPAETADEQLALERKLIERVLNGETELFYDLVHPYGHSVFLTAASILGNNADADEVAQEAMLKAFKYLARFRQESKFSTWLIRIAINEARMKLRKDRRHLYESLDNGRQTEDGDYIPTEVSDWREIPSQALEQTALREALQKALISLPERYRTVFILRDVQQMSITETAHTLGISEENVKTRTCRARLQMRDLLANSWGPSPARRES